MLISLEKTIFIKYILLSFYNQVSEKDIVKDSQDDDAVVDKGWKPLILKNAPIFSI
jgi:hypothetical protein